MVKQMSKGKGFIKKMQDFLKPDPKKDEQEFGPGKKGIIMCTKCNAYYHEKSWHNTLEGAIGKKDIDHFSDHDLTFGTCPACEMKKSKTFEGEVIIKLSDDSDRHDVLGAIHNSDEQARDRDPMDRVLWVSDKGSEIHVFTSENQLAVRIGKKLDSAFKGGKLDIKYSSGEDTARVTWEK